MASPADPSPKHPATVFYSWQTDLPPSTNRSLIEKALERAVKVIRSDGSLSVEPRLDQATQDVPGAPDIAHTIFEKIDSAGAFVADVSIINPSAALLTPNPNVLIELGYALHSLGRNRIVLVMNTINGRIEDLPFDLRGKRVLSYDLSQVGSDKPDPRKKLQDGLVEALRSIFAMVTPTVASQTLASVSFKPTNVIFEFMGQDRAFRPCPVSRAVAMCVRYWVQIDIFNPRSEGIGLMDVQVHFERDGQPLHVLVPSQHTGESRAGGSYCPKLTSLTLPSREWTNITLQGGVPGSEIPLIADSNNIYLTAKSVEGQEFRVPLANGITEGVSCS
ncbi:MAG TPA: hypothetical protein VG122_02440 [Gemmata sp.]|jgi:hypothetical protein|nr:hypothetical protein [Gemmata sp.]